jgi:serine/threonine protein kinase
MALALEHLHMCGIVYRCTLPETLLLDEDGRLQLTDFRFSKVLDGRTYTLCGAPEYLVGPHTLQFSRVPHLKWRSTRLEFEALSK